MAAVDVMTMPIIEPRFIEPNTAKPIEQQLLLQLLPCQQKALASLLAAVNANFPLVELRSAPGRGHGITTLLRRLLAEMPKGGSFFGVGDTLGCDHPEDALFQKAIQHLQPGAVVVIDDLDIATRPEKVRASRNAGENFQGAGQWAFEDATQPLRCLKALKDAAEKCGATVVFSTVEEGHVRYMHIPQIVRLDAAQKEDVEAFLSILVPDIDASNLLQRMPSVPTVAEMKSVVLKSSCHADGAINIPDLIAAARDRQSIDAAVSPEEVESVDLAGLPGLKDIANKLETHVLYPLLHQEQAQKQGLLPKRGVLLYGPPGTGKTTVGRALAHRLKGRFFMIRELLLFKDIFEVFEQAKSVAPSVVFFDDIDMLIGGWNGLAGGARSLDLIRFLLSQMDGLKTTAESQVVVVMAAADAKALPKAILRSGRIELWLKLEKPKPRERKTILSKYISEAQQAVAHDQPELLRSPLDLDEVSTACADFVPSDLRRIVADARCASAADGSKRCGCEYLKDAASDLRRMKEEVEGWTGGMYT